MKSEPTLVIPKTRSRFRLFLGKFVYRMLRHLHFIFNSNQYNLKQSDIIYSNSVFSHKTPLIRKLPRVQMQFQYNKIENLRIAVNKLNGVILSPGQSLSFWYIVGKPTKKKGYKEGFTLSQGKVTSGTGGGLCQLSNLIYWMTLHTPLDVIERYRHGYDVFPDISRKQPFGSGATVSYNYIDLVIKNNTANNFQLVLEVTDKYLIGQWFSEYPIDIVYEVVEANHRIECQPGGIYSRHNKLCRNVYDKKNKKMIRQEDITENHALMMYTPLLNKKQS